MVRMEQVSCRVKNGIHVLIIYDIGTVYNLLKEI